MEDELDRLAEGMFREFARFEYALKAAGFHNEDGDAKPDWRGFSETVADLFENPQNQELVQAIEFMLAKPPKKQVIQDGALAWSDVPPNTDLKSDLILQYVRRVRNNLFHGGKFNGRWFEPQRSELLLGHCLTILRACREISREVGEAYRN